MLEIPKNALLGALTWEASYFTALQLGKTIGLNSIHRGERRNELSFEYEMTLAKHRGLQENSEVAVAYLLRTVDFGFHWFYLNLGVGAGLSYAIGTPWYEDGISDAPEKRYHLQFFLPVELEWHFPQYKQVSFVTRIHHRSGVGGLIAPKRVGSNFITMGVRYAF